MYTRGGRTSYGTRGKGLDRRLRAYVAMVKSMDDSVGRVRAALQRKGIDKNTVILFCRTRVVASRTGRSAAEGSRQPLRGGVPRALPPATGRRSPGRQVPEPRAVARYISHADRDCRRRRCTICRHRRHVAGTDHPAQQHARSRRSPDLHLTLGHRGPIRGSAEDDGTRRAHAAASSNSTISTTTWGKNITGNAAWESESDGGQTGLGERSGLEKYSGVK